jgi:3-hydroxyacyl-CoA dehydrogenase / enoyl-CoA hydratase / 3-hydroxybutyryl-CoA epimerase
MLYESPHFRLEADDHVLTLWLDFRGRPGHTLTLPILHELNLVLDRVAGLPMPAALLIRSARPGVFLEEFDSAELGRFHSPLEFAALARRGQEAVRKLAALPFPTAALIEGRCAGAGLELGLACDRRWVVTLPGSRFEFPEVDRGLVPSWGGTYRLPRLVGIPTALRLFTNGSAGPAAARRAGLVDELIPPPQAAVRLLTLIDQLRGFSRKPRRSLRMAARIALSRLLSPARNWISTGAPDTGVAEPSPTAELRRLIAAGLSSEGEGLAAERATFTRLATSQSARSRLELCRRADSPVRVYPEPVNPIPRPPRRIGIVGGGDLGSRLAARFARAGHEVVVQDDGAPGVDRAVRLVRERLGELARRGDIAAGEASQLARDVRVTAEWTGFDNADLVIEAAPEDAGVKRNLFHELERRVRARVPLLSASTTVLVESIQSEAARPGRIAGLHLPNPDGRRPVAEIVGTNSTDPGTVAAALDWARLWGFVPVRVGDRPGRLVEHVRTVYLSEGVALVAEGLPIVRIDATCQRFGMARGPLEWCDDIGLDRLAERVAQLQLARGDRFARNLLFQRLLPFGCLGREVGEGFYRYGLVRRPSDVARMALWQDLDEDAQSRYVFDPKEALAEGIERVVLRTVNEAAAGLADEPDSDPGTVDVALAFGMDWAPDRGGPLRYADTVGLPTVVERLSAFAERFGPRYQPCDELVRRAEAGETFYGGPPTETAVPTAGWRLAG